VTDFGFDGRGPELLKLHWRQATLLAADYKNPDSVTVRHVVFHGSQAVQLTPEEVIGLPRPVTRNGSAAVNLGRSEWLESFAPQHLENCQHHQLLFYDQLIDVLCERLEFRRGPYNPLDAA